MTKLIELTLHDMEIHCINHNENVSKQEIENNIKDELLEIFGTKENIASKLYYVEILEPQKDEPFIAYIYGNLDFKNRYYGKNGCMFRIKYITKQFALEDLEKVNNIVKKTCKELGITQKELAARIGIAEVTINKWASDPSNITPQGIKSLELVAENAKLKQGIALLDALKSYIKDG
ncbi:MAG: helix-turn-helix transcriptional regulator [Campylobacteraceae bacterium]|jgi:DNA-binding XRE family transcriptional regulator|nr:helix-turn-helix transcriptional regulator [Campylobacteraceae bacterium]